MTSLGSYSFETLKNIKSEGIKCSSSKLPESFPIILKKPQNLSLEEILGCSLGLCVGGGVWEEVTVCVCRSGKLLLL